MMLAMERTALSLVEASQALEKCSNLKSLTGEIERASIHAFIHSFRVSKRIIESLLTLCYTVH